MGLYEQLAEAYSQPSKGYRTLEAALGAVGDIDKGFQAKKGREDAERKRKLQKSTLSEVLGTTPQGFEDFSNVPLETIESISPLAKFRNDSLGSSEDADLKRELIRARIEALRNPKPPKPTNPLDDELKRERINKMKKGAGSDKSVANAYQLYMTARKGLESSLDKTTTGPILGRLPALTANQQSADSAVAAMAPVLKQLFRVAGEGVFTDRDQELLLKMVTGRTVQPAARKAILKNVDNIVRAKLGMDDSGGGGGETIHVSNGTETREIDQADLAEALRDGYKPQ